MEPLELFWMKDKHGNLQINFIGVHNYTNSGRSTLPKNHQYLSEKIHHSLLRIQAV